MTLNLTVFSPTCQACGISGDTSIVPAVAAFSQSIVRNS